MKHQIIAQNMIDLERDITALMESLPKKRELFPDDSDALMAEAIKNSGGYVRNEPELYGIAEFINRTATYVQSNPGQAGLEAIADDIQKIHNRFNAFAAKKTVALKLEWLKAMPHELKRQKNLLKNYKNFAGRCHDILKQIHA